MNSWKNFKLSEVANRILHVVTVGDQSHGVGRLRVALIEPVNDGYRFGDVWAVAIASHCSCNGLDDTSWSATEYSGDELDKYMEIWKNRYILVHQEDDMAEEVALKKLATWYIGEQA